MTFYGICREVDPRFVVQPVASTPTRQHLEITKQYLQRCVTDKRGMPTKAAALDVAEQMMQDGKVNAGCHITPYLCNVCGEWHVYNRRIVLIDSNGVLQA